MKPPNRIHILIGMICIGLLPSAQAVVPPPDGFYPGFNTAEGQNALLSLTTGSANTAVGWFSLSLDATGSFNTATGAGSLLFNTGDKNTAFGTAALLFNTTGNGNTAVGAAVLLSNTTGNFNTATGSQALYSNTEGFNNTAHGYLALVNNTTGTTNTATGTSALLSNTTGDGNTATGFQALASNVTGAINTAIGANALLHVTTGSGNIALGAEAGSAITANNDVICIGAPGPENVSGACFIGHIFGTTSSGGTAVFINSDGRLGTQVSSRRFKEEIKPMERSSEALYALKPVTFRYKQEIDPAGISQFGLVAEEVEKINPDLIVRDKEGKPYSVRYDHVNAMLLNEFLKEHRKGEEQDLAISQLKSTLAQQQKTFESKLAQQEQQIAALTANLQKLAADIELNKAEAGTLAEK